VLPKTWEARPVAIPRFAADVVGHHIGRFTDAAAESLIFSASGTPLRASNFRRRVWYPAVAQIDEEGLRIHDMRHPVLRCSSPLALTRTRKAAPRPLQHPGHDGCLRTPLRGHDERDRTAAPGHPPRFVGRAPCRPTRATRNCFHTTRYRVGVGSMNPRLRPLSAPYRALSAPWTCSGAERSAI